MMIANIVSTSPVNAPQEFNIVASEADIIVSLPTLIIGYDYVNKHYPDFDITSTQLGHELYWTFKRTEKRDQYEKDLNWFISNTYKELVKDINYVFIDPIQYRNKTLVKIIKKIYSMNNLVTYVNNNMVYIYGEKLIFGVDLKLLSFMGVNVNKIKCKITKISSVFLDDSKILIEYKKNLAALDNRVRYLPFLYSIRHGQNNTFSIIHIPREN